MTTTSFSTDEKKSSKEASRMSDILVLFHIFIWLVGLPSVYHPIIYLSACCIRVESIVVSKEIFTDQSEELVILPGVFLVAPTLLREWTVGWLCSTNSYSLLASTRKPLWSATTTNSLIMWETQGLTHALMNYLKVLTVTLIQWCLLIPALCSSPLSSKYFNILAPEKQQTDGQKLNSRFHNGWRQGGCLVSVLVPRKNSWCATSLKSI